MKVHAVNAGSVRRAQNSDGVLVADKESHGKDFDFVNSAGNGSHRIFPASNLGKPKVPPSTRFIYRSDVRAIP